MRDGGAPFHEEWPSVLARVVDLMKRYSLGRKRILDTALAATLECSGVGRLATLNLRDFKIFPFLELVSPGEIRADQESAPLSS
jgi:hypothetical protein